MYSTLVWHENLLNHERELVMELVKGKQYANELQGLFQKSIPEDDDGFFLAETLAQNVLRSFVDSLAKIGLCRRPNELCQTNEAQEVTSQDLGEGKKRLEGIKMMKTSRGCYKKRKEEDASWRKYGQKKILNSRHPRSYYRCTHKYDQGCKAIKQVQKVDGVEKAMYTITYFGKHACKDHQRTPQLVQDIIKESSYMINLGENDDLPSNKNMVPSHVMQENNGDSQSDFDGKFPSIDSNLLKDTLGPEGYSPKMESFDHTPEVGSRFHATDASINFEGLDMIDFSQFTDFLYEDFEFLE